MQGAYYEAYTPAIPQLRIHRKTQRCVCGGYAQILITGSSQSAMVSRIVSIPHLMLCLAKESLVQAAHELFTRVYTYN